MGRWGELWVPTGFREDLAQEPDQGACPPFEAHELAGTSSLCPGMEPGQNQQRITGATELLALAPTQVQCSQCAYFLGILRSGRLWQVLVVWPICSVSASHSLSVPSPRSCSGITIYQEMLG